jgi:hypothetical protein
MKYRPNILAKNLKANQYSDMVDKLRNLVLNDTTGSVLAEKPLPTPSKAKSKPLPTIQPNYLDKVLDYKLDMFDYIASDMKLNPNLLIEYPTYYVVTITSYAPMQGYDSLTSKDFDIYINGVRLDVPDYRVWFNELGNIVFTIQKTAIPNDLNEENFLICGAFAPILLATELNTNIINTENDFGLVI